MKVVIEFYVVVSVITMLSSVFAYVYMMGGGRGGPGHLDHGGRALHLQRADQDQPAGHRLGRLGAAVPRLAAADRARCSRSRRRANEEEADGCDEPLEGQRRITALKHGILLLATLLALVPTIFMILTSLKSQEEYTFNKVGLPQALVLDHFHSVLFDSPFFAWMGNSIILAVGAVLLSTVVSCLGAYAIARMQFRGRSLLFSVSTALMAVPPVVMIVPLFVLYTQLGLISTYPGRHHHLCRPDHAVLGLSAHHLLPHPAAGALRVRAHRRRGRSPHPVEDRAAAVAAAPC